jgi:hypothetical protein
MLKVYRFMSLKFMSGDGITRRLVGTSGFPAESQESMESGKMSL